ncbi:actin organization and endocytosis protein [Coemansia sp. RSA 1200]|nr:actin organization and endocytosis protein [Coemansia sp. RSA 1200]
MLSAFRRLVERDLNETNAMRTIPPLTFIPATDLLSYAKTFQSNVAGGESARISGDSARRVLMQSKLPVSELGRIWELSDIRRLGSLSMAEFMLAMFLAQSRIRGKALPDALPPKIRAEVESSSTPATAATVNTASQMMQMQMPIPQASQPMQMSMPQPVHANINMNMPRPMAQMNMQQTNVPLMAPQSLQRQMSTPAAADTAGGGSSAVESVQEFATRYPDIAPSGAGAAPGALSSVKQSFTQNMLGTRAGESQHQWGIAGAERAQYEAIFRRWDPGHRGVLRGDQAREVFAQSGLSQQELAKIWGLADINNQGELNLNEFSVAMHLIFRRLAGAQIPDTLPADLVPRSSKDFMDSLNDMKGQLMFKDIIAGKPQTPGRSTSGAMRSYTDIGAAKSTVDESDNNNDDDDLYSYRSANRRRNHGTSASATGRNSTEPRSYTPQSPSAGTPGMAGASTIETIDRLRRDIRHRKDEVAEAKARAERRNKEHAESRVTLRWRIDDIKREIEDIHRSMPIIAGDDSSKSGGSGSDRASHLAKRDRLVANINEMTAAMPVLADEYKKLASDLVQARKEVAAKRNSKSSASSSSAAAGASDMESRAARLVAERMAALTGQPVEELGSSDNGRLGDEIAKIESKHKENLDRIESVTSGLGHVKAAMRELRLSDSAAYAGAADIRSEEVRELMDRLKRIERPIVKPGVTEMVQQKPATSPTRGAVSAFSPAAATANDAGPQSMSAATKPASAPSIAERLAKASTKQERDRLLQEMAEERFRERQNALGLPDKQQPESKEEPREERRVETSAVLRPEMQERKAPAVAAGRANPVGPSSETPLSSGAAAVAVAATAAASNPFSNQNHAPPKATAEASESGDAGNYTSIFGNSLELDYSDDSSEDEWDHDDSSDEGDAEKPGASAPSGNDRGGDSAESPDSSVSFNTAFAKPADGLQPKEVSAASLDQVDESNPFLGLLAAAAAAATATTATNTTSATNVMESGGGDGKDTANTGAGADASAATTSNVLDSLPAGFERVRVRALYPYAGNSAGGELEIETGQLIETRPVPSEDSAEASSTHAGDGWMYGEVLAESDEEGGDGWRPGGKRGWFPKEYAETLGAPGSRGWNKTKALFGTAKYDYQPQHDDELSVSLGDRVRVVDGDMAESWWKVRKITGSKETGMLPAIYIDLDKK